MWTCDSAERAKLVLTLSYCLMLAPIVGCSNDSGSNDPEMAITQEANGQTTDADSDPDVGVIESTWQVITETTESGLTIVSEKCASGSRFVLNATTTAWVWSADKTADGWGWIVGNAGDATEWASDRIGKTWSVTRQKTGEFSLWVQIKAKNGVAWARTALPESWRVVKDSAGEVWVWINKHKVEIAVAAAVVTVVAAGLIIAPEGVAPAVIKGAVAGAASHGTTFLVALWENRAQSEDALSLEHVSKDMFLSIGRSVLSQCGTQVLASIPVDAV